MQLKTLDKEKPIIVVCSDGKTSEAAVFLLLRNKINAMILKGGMAGINPEPEHDAALSNTTDDIEVFIGRPELIPQERTVKQPDNNSVSIPNNAQDEHIRLLQSEIEALKMTNQQLNDKCTKLEFDKQHAEKQARIFYNQLEKLTQVLDKLKAGG
jgi:hypothetical protein